MSNVYIKTKVRSGKEAMKYLGKYKNKTVLIVCDKFMAENGSVNTVINAIDSSCRVEMFDQAVPDPTTEVVGKGLNKLSLIHIYCRIVHRCCGSGCHGKGSKRRTGGTGTG